MSLYVVGGRKEGWAATVPAVDGSEWAVALSAVSKGQLSQSRCVEQ